MLSTHECMYVCVCVSPDIVETAYIRALQVAVIAHTVAKACRTRTLASCGCATFNSNNMPQGDGNTYSGDCSDNFEFGYQFALNFTTSGITSTTVQAKTDIHNFNAGINVSGQFPCWPLPENFFLDLVCVFHPMGSITKAVEMHVFNSCIVFTSPTLIREAKS